MNTNWWQTCIYVLGVVALAAIVGAAATAAVLLVGSLL